MLKNIFIIISQKNKNKIRKLKLRRNKIEDPSILNRILFNFLEELDLSSNNIKNLKFLKGMKAKNLKRLYLNDNYINDLSPLYNIKEYFQDLNTISLNNNNFNPEASKFKHLIVYLEYKNIEIIYASLFNKDIKYSNKEANDEIVIEENIKIKREEESLY